MVKYTFPNVVNGTNDMFTNFLIDLNNGVSGWMMYGFLVIFIVVAYYVVLKKTSDIGKGAISASWVNLIMSFIFYYWGQVAIDVTTQAAANFVSGTMLVTFVLIHSGGLAYLYYQRGSV